MKISFLLGIICLSFLSMKCSSTEKPQQSNLSKDSTLKTSTIKMDTATFGAGCFWCVEVIFQQVKGVYKVTSGYTGGKISNPTYKEVCSGLTGHAEVVQIEYNPAEITFKDLLSIFWQTHDPTTLNKQGADEGTQYRSVVFYHTKEQQELAEFFKKELNASGAYSSPVVTEISEYDHKFYKAEDYHQNYYNLNSEQPYCRYVIKPKLDKFNKVFKSQFGK